MTVRINALLRNLVPSYVFIVPEDPTWNTLQFSRVKGAVAGFCPPRTLDVLRRRLRSIARIFLARRPLDVEERLPVAQRDERFNVINVDQTPRSCLRQAIQESFGRMIRCGQTGILERTMKRPKQPVEQNIDMAHAILLAVLVDLASARYDDQIAFRNQLMSILEGEIEGLGIPHNIDVATFAQFKLDTVARLRRLVTIKSTPAPLPH
jgi:hypothetical protein